MSKLFGIARKASDYFRDRLLQAADKADERLFSGRSTSDYVQQKRSLGSTLANFIFGGKGEKQTGGYPPKPPGGLEQRQGPPPVVAPQPTSPSSQPQSAPTPQPIPRPNSSIPPPNVRPQVKPIWSDPPVNEEKFDDIQVLGRDRGYHLEDWQVVMDQMRLTPGSSNVYGYYFEFESRTTGILYVTFLGTIPGGGRGGAGPTYAYYTVPGRKYHEFQKAAEASAGNAVWDYLRVRGTMWGHQYQYRLIQPGGDYVPRKATKAGFRTRNVAAIGVGRRSYVRSTLPERLFPTRGKPDRGEPNRGEPDRGE